MREHVRTELDASPTLIYPPPKYNWSPQMVPDIQPNGCGRCWAVVHCLVAMVITSTVSRFFLPSLPPATTRACSVVTEAVKIRAVGMGGKTSDHCLLRPPVRLWRVLVRYPPPNPPTQVRRPSMTARLNNS